MSQVILGWKTALGLAAGLAGVVIYCIYFDQKRRNDPQFKQKLRKKREQKENVWIELPNLNVHNPEEYRQFCEQLIVLAEQLIRTGKTDVGVECYCLSFIYCDNICLNSLQLTLSSKEYQLLKQRLPNVFQKWQTISDYKYPIAYY